MQLTITYAVIVINVKRDMHVAAMHLRKDASCTCSTGKIYEFPALVYVTKICCSCHQSLNLSYMFPFSGYFQVSCAFSASG